MMRQLCHQIAVSGYGRRVTGLRMVGGLLVPSRPREKPEGWLIVEVPRASDRLALSELVGKDVRLRTGLTNGMAKLTWLTHVVDTGDWYAGTSRLCVRGRCVPATVIVAETRQRRKEWEER